MTKKAKQKHMTVGEYHDARGDRGSTGSPLHKLRKAWKKASESERTAFLTELGLPAGQPADPLSMASGERRLIANGRYLLSITVSRIETVMIRRRLLPDALMEELGFPGEGKDLARALAKGGSLRLRVIASLDDWLTTQENGTTGETRNAQNDRKQP